VYSDKEDYQLLEAVSDTMKPLIQRILDKEKIIEKYIGMPPWEESNVFPQLSLGFSTGIIGSNV